MVCQLLKLETNSCDRARSQIVYQTEDLHSNRGSIEKNWYKIFGEKFQTLRKELMIPASINNVKGYLIKEAKINMNKLLEEFFKNLVF